MRTKDPKLQQGAYITDGIDLYEVMGERRITMTVRPIRVVVENCRDMRGGEFLPESISNTFDLVRQSPVARCPDVIDEITW